MLMPLMMMMRMPPLLIMMPLPTVDAPDAHSLPLLVLVLVLFLLSRGC